VFVKTQRVIAQQRDLFTPQTIDDALVWASRHGWDRLETQQSGYGTVYALRRGDDIIEVADNELLSWCDRGCPVPGLQPAHVLTVFAPGDALTLPTILRRLAEQRGSAVDRAAVRRCLAALVHDGSLTFGGKVWQYEEYPEL
jgi:hypothetical protein